MISRREFLKRSSWGLLGVAALPAFARRALAQAPASNKTFVLIFQRGAADGLSIVPPIAEPRYHSLRPTLALKPTGDGAALKLDGFFGLHPALAPILPLYQSGTLAILHQIGSPDPTRSHFDAQDYFELGTPGQKSDEGFLNRTLGVAPTPAPGPFRAIALQPNLPLSMQGSRQTVAVAELADFDVTKSGGGSFEDMYRVAVDSALRGVGDEAFSALHAIKQTGAIAKDAEVPLGYPKGGLGRRLFELAALLKSGQSVQSWAARWPPSPKTWARATATSAWRWSPSSGARCTRTVPAALTMATARRCWCWAATCGAARCSRTGSRWTTRTSTKVATCL